MGAGPVVFETAFRNAVTGVALVSPDGRFREVNDALCELLGYSRQSLLQADAKALTHAEDVPRDLSLLRQLLAGEVASYRVEKRYLHASGREVHALVTVSLVRTDDGAPDYLLLQVEDVTGRRKAERDVALLFEASPDMLALASESGTLERLNQAWERVLGWSLEELTASGLLHFVHGDDRSDIERQLARLGSGHAGQEGRSRVRCKDGSYRWLAWTLRRGDGSRTLCVARDVTRHVTQEEHLRLSQHALGAVNDGVLVTDCSRPDNPIVYCNASFERISGYRSEELVGKSCRILQGGDRDQPELAVLRAAVREGRPCHVVLRNYRKDGELFLNSLSVSPVRNEHGQVTHYVGSVEDITERVHMEDQLRRAALIDELTGLYNRRGFLLLAEQQMRLSARHRQPVGLLYMELEGIKRINEELGHDSGDDALIDVATILHRALRSSDVVARLGGDEFVALVEGDADDVNVLRDRLTEHVSRHNQVANRAYRITLGVGSAVCMPERPLTLNELLARADEAMYAVRHRRRAAHAN